MAGKERSMSEFEEVVLTEEQEAQKRFECKNDRDAEWCMSKKIEAEDLKKFWKAYYTEQYEKICKDLDWTIAIMEHHLFNYFEKVPHKKAKASESYNLPNGKLVLKRQDPTFEMEDADLVEYLKSHKLDNYVKTEVITKPAWGDFKKTLAKDPDGNFSAVEMEDGLHPVTADGEVVQCISMEIRPPKFEAK